MKNSNIEWTDHTFNPWEGCTKVSPGCLHCYAETRNQRFSGGLNWGKGAPRRRTSKSNWNQPLKWNDEAGESAEDLKFIGVTSKRAPRPRVFSASLADWLDAEVDPTWRHDFLNMVRLTPNLDWLLLTKRPQNFERLIGNVFEHAVDTDLRAWAWDWLHAKPPANVWVGTTVEDQARADERIPILMEIPAHLRFLSCEPLLEDIDLHPLEPGMSLRLPVSWLEEGCGANKVDWVICGGESGPGARRMEISWARSLRRQCLYASVPFFMKQLGGSPDKRGELLDLPEDLRVREFPT